MMYLDSHPDVVMWASEELSIPYRSPIDNKIHRYFPDFLIKKRNPDGIQETLLIEVKPSKQVCAPVKRKTTSRSYIKEVMTYGINEAKWKAAKSFCEDRKWKFVIMTEKELGV